MKIGITQIILGDMSLEETLDLCAEAGYQAVELVFREGKDLHPDMSDGELAAVARRCAAAGVEIGSVIANYPDRGSLLSRQAAERQACCRSLARSLEVAGVLGAGAVLLHPGQLTVEGTYEEAWDALRDALAEMAVRAAASRVVIGLENVWNKFLLSPREASQFVDAVGSPWVGLYLDTANMMAYGFPEHWIRSLGKRLARVHLKDFARRDHRFVNLLEGDTDWPAVMAELRRAGYQGPVVHEVGGDRAALVDLAERMRRIVAM